MRLTCSVLVNEFAVLLYVASTVFTHLPDQTWPAGTPPKNLLLPPKKLLLQQDGLEPGKRSSFLKLTGRACVFS
jgi:hypothetical protein